MEGRYDINDLFANFYGVIDDIIGGKPVDPAVAQTYKDWLRSFWTIDKAKEVQAKANEIAANKSRRHYRNGF
jgi:hypothetical protein